ncbi:MAG: hypothetical protein RLZZ31_1381 [Actinomycetota bacterium]|jgi:nitrate/nitrite-specific signal transduction histidine kinase
MGTGSFCRRNRTYDAGVVQSNDLDQLLKAIVAVGSEHELPTVLRRIVDSATELSGAKWGALGVLDETGTFLSQFLYSGIDEETAKKIGDLPSGRGILGLLIVEPTPIRIPHIRNHPERFGFPPNHPEMDSFLGVPIRVRGEVFGNLYLTGKDEDFTDKDEELVVGLATAAGVAIENARLQARIGELHVVEDRERIARDLHDTVIQRMFAMGLGLQSLANRSNDPELTQRLQEIVDELDETVRHIRTTIFELQRRRLPGRSVRQEIIELVEELCWRANITPTISFSGPIDLVIADSTATHLVAVVGEAITNVVRHSQATAVAVSVRSDENITLTISDNGIGLHNAQKDGNGLRNIKSRAAQLDGQVELNSTDEGTTIIWTVPNND